MEKNLEHVKHFLWSMTNSRSLYQDDLANLFKLIYKLTRKHKLAQPKDFDHLVMNVATNLQTLSVNLFSGEKKDTFEALNAIELDEDRSLKKMILHTYKDIYKRDPSIFEDEKHSYSLSPLSSLMAEIFDSFEHNDVLECMHLLGTRKIDNYSNSFILKLYENYATQQFMSQLHEQNPKFFFEFSKAWPVFLRNNAILNELTKVKGDKIMVRDQSETI